MNKKPKPLYRYIFPYYNEGTFLYISISIVCIALIDPKVQKGITGYFEDDSSDIFTIVISFSMPFLFIMSSFFNAFIKRKKSKFELTINLWFIAVFNLLIGFQFIEYFSQKNLDYLAIFPVINIIHSMVILFVLKYGNDEIENEIIKLYIDEKDISLGEAFVGSTLTVLLLFYSYFVLKNEWFITFSIVISYASILNSKLNDVFRSFKDIILKN